MLQGRNVESFDHVQKDLRVEDEGEAAKDPAFFLKSEGLSEDMKRVMAKLCRPASCQALVCSLREGYMLQGRNVESFDHVQKDLKVEDEDEAAKDPAFFLKTEGLSEDMKRVMAKLYTPDALKVRQRVSRARVAATPALLPPNWAALTGSDET